MALAQSRLVGLLLVATALSARLTIPARNNRPLQRCGTYAGTS